MTDDERIECVVEDARSDGLVVHGTVRFPQTIVPLAGMREITACSFLGIDEDVAAYAGRSYGPLFRKALTEKLLVPKIATGDHPFHDHRTVEPREFAREYPGLTALVRAQLGDQALKTVTVARVLARDRTVEQRLDEAGVVYTAFSLDGGFLEMLTYRAEDLGLRSIAAPTSE